MLGQGIAGTLGGGYRQVVDTARQIMAYNLASQGRSGWDEGMFRLALGTAMGATRRQNGLMQGGVQNVRGRPVELPEWQTAPEFDQALSRLDYGGAVYASGKAVDKADVLSHYTPRYYATDEQGRVRYHMLDQSGQALRARDGSAFVVYVRRPS